MDLVGLAFVASVSFIAFLLGLFLGQKIKDALFGVPTAVRSSMKSVEVSLLSKLKTAEGDVVAEFKKLTGTAPPEPAPPAS